MRTRSGAQAPSPDAWPLRRAAVMAGVLLLAGCGAEAEAGSADAVSPPMSSHGDREARPEGLTCKHRTTLTNDYGPRAPGERSAIAAARAYADPGDSVRLLSSTANRAQALVVNEADKPTATIDLDNSGRGWLISTVTTCGR